MVHLSVTGGGRFLGRAQELEVNLASSETQVVNESGVPTFAVSSAVSPKGPCTEGPFSWKLSTGGVLPTAASVKGESSHSVFRLPGTVVVWPLTVSVQAILFW